VVIGLASFVMLIQGIGDGNPGVAVFGGLGCLLIGAWIWRLWRTGAEAAQAASVAAEEASKLTVAMNLTLQNALKSIPNFSSNKFFIDFAANDKLIAIDNQKRLLSLICFTGEGENVSSRSLRPSEILSCEIDTVGATITQTQKKGGISNAVAGAVIAGGAGAVVGATQAKSTSTTNNVFSEIGLRLGIADLEVPTFKILFYRGDPIAENSTEAIQAMGEAKDWRDRIAALKSLGSE
jgi:hypothetical protein